LSPRFLDCLPYFADVILRLACIYSDTRGGEQCQ